MKGVVNIKLFDLPALAEQAHPFQELLKKGRDFVWREKQARAFESIKKALAAPLTMVAPTKGCLLILYFTSTEKSIGE